MSEKDFRYDWGDFEQEESILTRVFFFILSLILLVLGVKWLISICLKVLIPENN